MALVRAQVDTWDELIAADGSPRPAAAALLAQLEALEHSELQERQTLAEVDILTMGITFTVYTDGKGIDRAWPFDIIPRVIAASEWRHIELGLKQRLTAINHFINDLYHEQLIIRDGVFPADLLEHSVNFRPECVGVNPAFGVWAHISGSDLVRDADGTMYVLEDNLRVPSGVSYVLENRAISKRVFADLFARQSILPVDAYTDELNRMLVSIAPDGISNPTIAVLTPGIYNSAYFEHSFLAQRLGAALVEGADLVVGYDDCVYMRTIGGRERVHVIYRRIDDLFMDPEAFRPDSTLGVPGLMRAWRAGTVAIANAPGAGVADDKVVYAWVPAADMHLFGRVREPNEMGGIWRQLLLTRAANDEEHTKGQDGGYVSAMLNWLLEHDYIEAALVSGVEDDDAWKAKPVVVTNRDEVLATAGSRYTYCANPLALREAKERGFSRLALVGMGCQTSSPPVMWDRKAGKVSRPFLFNIGLLCSKTFDDAIFPELFEAKYGLKKQDMVKMNIKGVFQIWMKDGSYHEVDLKECHKWTREGCKSCPDFAAEHSDIATGGIGKDNDWTLTIVRTELGEEVINRMIADGTIIAKPAQDDEEAMRLLRLLSIVSRRRWPEWADKAPAVGVPPPKKKVAPAPAADAPAAQAPAAQVPAAEVPAADAAG